MSEPLTLVPRLWVMPAPQGAERTTLEMGVKGREWHHSSDGPFSLLGPFPSVGIGGALSQEPLSPGRLTADTTQRFGACGFHAESALFQHFQLADSLQGSEVAAGPPGLQNPFLQL